MKVSVAPQAEEELIEGALFYAREATPELGHAFVSEFERSVALLQEHARLVRPGEAQRGAFRFAASRTASSITSPIRKSVSLLSPISGASQSSGRAARRAQAALLLRLLGAS